MPTLTVTKNYADGSILTEAMLDAIKSSLETFFNTTKIDSANIQNNGVSSANLADDAVLNAKLRNSVGVSVIGRTANTTGDPADIAAASNGQVLKREGDVLLFSSVAATDIADNAITNAKLRDSVGVSVIGRSANSTGDPADIVAASNGQVLKREANALIFDTVDTADITNGAVTPIKQGAQNFAQYTIVDGTHTFVGAGTFQIYSNNFTPIKADRLIEISLQSVTTVPGFFSFDVASSAAIASVDFLVDGVIVASCGATLTNTTEVGNILRLPPSAFSVKTALTAVAHLISINVSSSAAASIIDWQNVAICIAES